MINKGINFEYITVHIPTYNRKNELKNTLRLLSDQTDDRFYVKVSDNASEYDLETVLEGLPDEFKNRCTLERRRFNIGAGINYVMGFAECSTKWIWNIGDDDIINADSIETIYRCIEKVPDASCINFSLADDMNFDVDGVICCNSFKGFADIYNYSWKKKNSYLHGDLIFLTNKVFNNTKIRPYLGYIISNSYFPAPVVYLILKILEHSGKYVCVKDKIVTYLYDHDKTKKWVYQVVLSSRILYDITFDMDKKTRRDILGCCAYGIRTLYYLYFCEREDNNVNQVYFLEVMYYNLYKHFLPIHRRIGMKIIADVCKSNLGFRLTRRCMNYRFGKQWIGFKQRIKDRIC